MHGHSHSTLSELQTEMRHALYRSSHNACKLLKCGRRAIDKAAGATVTITKQPATRVTPTHAIAAQYQRTLRASMHGRRHRAHSMPKHAGELK